MEVLGSGHLECCGVRCIKNVYPNIKQVRNLSIKDRTLELKRWQKIDTGLLSGDSRAHIAILTDDEIVGDLGLAKDMKDMGFKLVQRFKNPSGSMCNILVWTNKPKPLRSKSTPWHNL